MKTSFLMQTMLIILLLTGTLYSQETQNHRKFGLSASLQTDQMDIAVPIWIGDKTILAPALSILHVEDVGTDLGIGIVPKFYLRMNKVSPYVVLRAGTLFFLPKHSDNTFDWVAGAGFGADYFFDERFSIGVEAQLNMTISDKKSDRFGNPGGMNYNTATAIVASIYF